MGFSKEVFAANLRASRAAMRMSQKELANAVGVSEDAISKYESGKGYVPGTDKLLEICRVVKKSPNELVGWQEVASKTSA